MSEIKGPIFQHVFGTGQGVPIEKDVPIRCRTWAHWRRDWAKVNMFSWNRTLLCRMWGGWGYKLTGWPSHVTQAGPTMLVFLFLFFFFQWLPVTPSLTILYHSKNKLTYPVFTTSHMSHPSTQVRGYNKIKHLSTSYWLFQYQLLNNSLNIHTKNSTRCVVTDCVRVSLATFSLTLWRDAPCALQ